MKHTKTLREIISDCEYFRENGKIKIRLPTYFYNIDKPIRDIILKKLAANLEKDKITTSN